MHGISTMHGTMGLAACSRIGSAAKSFMGPRTRGSGVEWVLSPSNSSQRMAAVARSRFCFQRVLQSRQRIVTRNLDIAKQAVKIVTTSLKSQHCRASGDNCDKPFNTAGGRTNSWIIPFLVKNISNYIIAYKIKQYHF